MRDLRPLAQASRDLDAKWGSRQSPTNHVELYQAPSFKLRGSAVALHPGGTNILRSIGRRDRDMPNCLVAVPSPCPSSVVPDLYEHFRDQGVSEVRSLS